MSWDKYDNEDGTITLCYMEYDERWGNWGEAIVTKEEEKRWSKGEKEMEEEVWRRMK